MLSGIDVSHYNGTVDWTKVKAAGIDFAFVKCTEGVSFVDPKFRLNWDAMQAEGVRRGAYHFFVPTKDISEQADLFCGTVGTFIPGDLPPAIDLEEVYYGGEDQWLAVSKERRVPIILDWLQRVELTLKVKPIIYCRRSWINVEIPDTTPLQDYKIWIASYGTLEPLLPSGWDEWTFWQKNSHGKVPGIDGYVDLNVFNGELADLEGFVVSA